MEKAGKEIDTVESISAETLKKKLQNNIHVFNVRNVGEYSWYSSSQSGYIPLGFINDFLKKFPSNEKFYVHFADGCRSVIVASIL